MGERRYWPFSNEASVVTTMTRVPCVLRKTAECVLDVPCVEQVYHLI
jgi:hypothetical protein